MVSLGDGDLLGDRLVMFAVADALAVAAFELGEPDAVGGVADVEVEHGPDQGEAAVSPGKRPMTLVRRLTSPSERSSRFVERQRRRCRVG